MAWRLASLAVAALLVLAVMPALSGLLDLPPHRPAPALHGAAQGGYVRYRDARLGDVLLDIEAMTGFRAVTPPEQAARSYSGKLAIAGNGQAAVASLARQTGLHLRRAGPHWALMPE